MRVDAVRLHAYEQLLGLPDEVRDDRRRGHHLVAAGRGTRFQQLWVPAVRVWTQHRMRTSTGIAVDGWKPAVTHRTGHVLRMRS